MTEAKQPAVITIGICEDGRAITWPASQGSPHMMVVGSTGSGATTFLRYLAGATAGQHQVVHVLDPKRTDFIGVPGVEEVASSSADWSCVLQRVHELMHARYSQLETGVAETFGPVTLVISCFDEVVGRLEPCDRHKLDELVSKGRSANIRCVLGASRLNSDMCSAQTRENIGTWMAFEPISPLIANLIWGTQSVAGLAPWGLGTAVVAGEGQGPVEVTVPASGQGEQG